MILPELFLPFPVSLFCSRELKGQVRKKSYLLQTKMKLKQCVGLISMFITTHQKIKQNCFEKKKESKIRKRNQAKTSKTFEKTLQ